MNPIQVLIVDDERLSRKRLRRMLVDDPALEVMGECQTGREALEVISKRKPDLLFLDIEMPEMDGFGLLDALGDEQMPCTIFVTAFDQFALRAFEFHAFDYLLKPYEEKRLHESVRRAKAQLLARDPAADRERLNMVLDSLNKKSRYRDRIAVRSGENLLLVRTEQVDWIEAADNYVYLHCGQEKHLLRETMTSLQNTLDPAHFLRIHRSAIVNLDRVKALQPWFRGDYRVVLSTGAQLTLSRSYRQSLEDRLLKL